MNDTKDHHVFPAKKAAKLTSFLRLFRHNPKTILRPHLEEGQTVLDFGCGPGFFTTEMARRVGEKGQVIAVDLQEGMLSLAKKRAEKKNVSSRIQFHQCPDDHLGLNLPPLDFVLAFHVFHEHPDLNELLNEIVPAMKPQSRLLVTEPTHRVSEEEFQSTIQAIREAGLTLIPHIKSTSSHEALFIK